MGVDGEKTRPGSSNAAHVPSSPHCERIQEEAPGINPRSFRTRSSDYIALRLLLSRLACLLWRESRLLRSVPSPFRWPACLLSVCYLPAGDEGKNRGEGKWHRRRTLDKVISRSFAGLLGARSVGLELATSSLSGKHDALLELPRVCKIPANIHILKQTLFPSFQDIYPGCCTVAAHEPDEESQPIAVRPTVRI